MTAESARLTAASVLRVYGREGLEIAAVVCGYFSGNNGRRERRVPSIFVHVKGMCNINDADEIDWWDFFDCVTQQRPGWSEEKTHVVIEVPVIEVRAKEGYFFLY